MNASSGTQFSTVDLAHESLKAARASIEVTAERKIFLMKVLLVLCAIGSLS